jgi:hypothetical protein
MSKSKGGRAVSKTIPGWFDAATTHFSVPATKLGVPAVLPEQTTARVTDFDDDANPTPRMASAKDTARVVWGQIEDATVRVSFSESASDGVPCGVEAETSAPHSSAVKISDLAQAFEVLAQLAERDEVPFDVKTQRVVETAQFSYKAATSDEWLLRLSGNEAVSNRVEGFSLTILDWRVFRTWLPRVLREVEGLLFSLFPPRVATAVVLKLRAFASELPADVFAGRNDGIIRL